MFGKTKRYAALFAAGLTLASCGGIQDGSMLDPVFWERSDFSKTAESMSASDRGLAELVKGNYLPAEALFDQALGADPRNVYALLGKAMIYQNTGQMTRARALYEAVLAQRPDESLNVIIWTDATPRNVAEVATMNLSMIDSGNVVGNLAHGAAGVDKPADMGGVPGYGMTAGSGSYGKIPMNGTTALRQTDMEMQSGTIPEMGMDEGTRNIVSRFNTLRDLLDQGLITPEEFKVRRSRNVGALVPLSTKPPAAGLDRPVPTSAQIAGRLRAIGRALEMRAITIEQHAAERKMILDALMPETPLVLANPSVPPQGLMASADAVRRLEGLQAEGLISSDEYARERNAIEKGLQPVPPGAAMTNNAMGGAPTAMQPNAKKKMSGPQPAVHLASYKSERDASRGWAQLKRAHRNLLGNLDSEILQVNLGPGKGVFYRLLAGPLDNKGSAASLCQKLKSKRQFCEPGFMGTNS